VVDADGNFIGLAAFGPRNRALVIPAETVDRIAEALAVKGSIARGYLGVALRPFWRRRGTGAVVVKVDADGPQARRGPRRRRSDRFGAASRSATCTMCSGGLGPIRSARR